MSADDEIMRMQDEGLTGFGESSRTSCRWPTRAQDIERAPPRNCPASALVVGMQCGGSDAFRRDRQSGAGLCR